MAVVTTPPGAWTIGFGATDLDALANGSQRTSSLTSPHIDNAAGGAVAIQFELTLAALSPVAGANVLIALVPETRTAGTYVSGVDGATTADQTRWQNGPNVSLALRLTASAAQVHISNPIMLPPGRFRLMVINRAGVALGAGNQVYFRTIAENVT